MRLSFSRTRLSPIAVDFGADSIKLLQVIAVDPPQLVAAAAIELPEAARTDMTARAAFIPDAVKQLVADQPFRGRKAICSIPAFHTLVQNLQVPGGADDFEAQVGLQLQQHLNVNPARMVLRSLVVDGLQSSQKQEVVCMAASLDVVMSHIELARRAKLDAVGLHCEPVAMMTAFRHLYRRQGDDQRTTAFIDIGAVVTKIVIAHGSAIVLAKTIHTAGDHFTRHCAKTRGVSFEQAKAIRIQQTQAEPPSSRQDRGAMPQCPLPATAMTMPARSAGLATIAEPGPGSAEPPAQPPVQPPVQVTSQPNPDSPPPDPIAGSDALDCLIDELMLCLRYHRNLFPERSVEKLVFLGGESRDIELCQKLARAVGIGAQLGDPLARLARTGNSRSAPGVDLRRPQPGWAVPMGLCLGETNL